MKIKNIFVLTSTALVFLSCFQENEARRPVSNAGGSYIKKSVERNKDLLAKEESQIDLAIQNISEEIFESTHGFSYFYNFKNNQESKKPTVGMEAIFTYQVSDLNNKLIYSFDEIGYKNYKIDHDDELIGLRHAIKLLSVGDTATFYFPSHLTYGYLGDQNKIERNTPLQFQLTIKELNQVNINN